MNTKGRLYEIWIPACARMTALSVYADMTHVNERGKRLQYALLNVPPWQEAKRPVGADLEGVLENPDAFYRELKAGESFPLPDEFIKEGLF